MRQRVGSNYAWRMRYLMGCIHILEETQVAYGMNTKEARVSIDKVRSRLRERFILMKAGKI